MPSLRARDDDLEDLLHDQRRQALRRLVEHQQLRVEQQRAGDRQHFLLAARKLAALVGSCARPAAETARRCAAMVHGPGRSSGTLRFSSTVRLAKMRRPSGT